MLVEKAREAAAAAHAGQFRADGRTPYIWHCRDVAAIVSQQCTAPEVIAAAWLHDVVEDSDWTVERIEAEFGSYTAELVAALTKPETAGEQDWVVERAQSGAMPVDAALIKLADIESNMSDLPNSGWDAAKKARQAAEAERRIAALNSLIEKKLG